MVQKHEISKKLKKIVRTKTKVFLDSKEHNIFRKLEKIKLFSHSNASIFSKKGQVLLIFSVLDKLTHMCRNASLNYLEYIMLYSIYAMAERCCSKDDVVTVNVIEPQLMFVCLLLDIWLAAMEELVGVSKLKLSLKLILTHQPTVLNSSDTDLLIDFQMFMLTSLWWNVFDGMCISEI